MNDAIARLYRASQRDLFDEMARCHRMIDAAAPWAIGDTLEERVRKLLAALEERQDAIDVLWDTESSLTDRYAGALE